MPYISSEAKESLLHDAPRTSGELNYLLTIQVLEYLNVHGTSYQVINDIMGAFEGAKAEFYRRVAVPYEQSKIAANGDVYPQPAGSLLAEKLATLSQLYRDNARDSWLGESQP